MHIIIIHNHTHKHFLYRSAQAIKLKVEIEHTSLRKGFQRERKKKFGECETEGFGELSDQIGLNRSLYAREIWLNEYESLPRFLYIGQAQLARSPILQSVWLEYLSTSDLFLLIFSKRNLAAQHSLPPCTYQDHICQAPKGTIRASARIWHSGKSPMQGLLPLWGPHWKGPHRKLAPKNWPLEAS